MTFYVMAPTFDRAWQDGVQPLMDNKITEAGGLRAASPTPFRTFMRAKVRDKDLKLFDEPRASEPACDAAAERRAPRSTSAC